MRSNNEVVEKWILYRNFMNIDFEGLQEAKFDARLPGRLARPAGWLPGRQGGCQAGRWVGNTTPCGV